MKFQDQTLFSVLWQSPPSPNHTPYKPLMALPRSIRVWKKKKTFSFSTDNCSLQAELKTLRLRHQGVIKMGRLATPLPRHRL